MNHPMEPPRLLLDDDADPIVCRLLEAGRREGPSKQAVLAAPAAIAAIMATETVTTAAAATVAAATTVTPATVATAAVAPMSSAAIAVLPILAKSIGIGLVVGGAMVATAVKVTDPANHEPASIAAVSATSSRQLARAATPIAASVPTLAQVPENSAQVLENSAQVLEGSPQENSIGPVGARAMIPLRTPDARSVPARVSPQPRSVPPNNDHPEISREIELIDAARRALAVGDPGRAIAQLDRHAALGRRLLEPEATVLRVRALLAQQRTTEAARVANGFIARQPSSPQAPVLRQLIAGDDMRDPN